MTDTQRYDRQLRLWGEHGQAALENAHICLIGAGVVGTESLKNLVLPGIGSFTIVDGKKVEGPDIGNNFFVDSESLGLSLAEKTTELLKELNDRVHGFHREQDAASVVESNIQFFKDFQLILVTDLVEPALHKLAAYCWEQNIPLVVAKAYGFVGYIRLVVPEHTIIETHPDNSVHDLRLTNPFEEFQSFVDSIDLSSLNSHDHSHVPFVVILIKLMNQWKNEHDGNMPKTYPEKNEFKKLIQSSANGYDNYDEALKNAFRSWTLPSIPSSVKAVIESEKSKRENLNANSDSFWILSSALKDFVEKNGVLPNPGTLPDMHADTNSFIALQNIFFEKSVKDIAEITKTSNEITEKLGKEPIFEEEIKRFVKHASLLKVIEFRSIEQEISPDSVSQELVSGLEDPDSNLSWYLGLRGANTFHSKNNRYPGFFDEDVEKDIPELKNICSEIAVGLKLQPNVVKDDVVHEICRFGAAEIHNIGSLMGGVVSQEVIKLITHQFVPLDNTYIFNGMNSTSTRCTL